MSRLAEYVRLGRDADKGVVFYICTLVRAKLYGPLEKSLYATQYHQKS